MLSAHDVARELRRRLPDAGDLKIHKLVYYCQSWHVTWLGEPMFHERLEAWANGPVVADLWHDERGNRPRPAEGPLGDQHLAVVDYVVSRYGRHSGAELARMTHLEDPWREVSEADSGFRVANPEITVDRLIAWFSADEEYLAHQKELAQLIGRRDARRSEGEASEALDEATLRALAQQR